MEQKRVLGVGFGSVFKRASKGAGEWGLGFLCELKEAVCFVQSALGKGLLNGVLKAGGKESFISGER